MKDFATIANTTGAYPDVEAEDVTAPGAADGTPVIAQWVNEFMGAMQAILNAAGMTPSGSIEADGACQLLEAIRKAGHYPGEIITWAGPQTDLTSLGIRALALTGQGIVRANYADLDTAVYCGDPNNASAEAYFRSNTASAPYSRSTSGTYLILPNLGGRFLRAVDPTGSVDVDGGASRLSGSAQSDAYKSHYHNKLYDTSSANSYKPFLHSYNTGASTVNLLKQFVSGSYEAYTGPPALTGYSSNETRATNIGVRFFICY